GDAATGELTGVSQADNTFDSAHALLILILTAVNHSIAFDERRQEYPVHSDTARTLRSAGDHSRRRIAVRRPPADSAQAHRRLATVQRAFSFVDVERPNSDLRSTFLCICKWREGSSCCLA
ncbi:MAG: hypothetical protein QXT77_08075, partial [Candidatus Methanomethylicaceae archaeon]